MARSIFLFSTFLTAVCVPHFDLLMGLTGSLTGALLSFIFPCIFHINIKKLKLEYYQVFFDIVILLMGTVCSVTGVYRSGKIWKNLWIAFYVTAIVILMTTICWWVYNSDSFNGYIDVGDGCWRPNVLVTSLRCSWPIQVVGDRFITFRKSPTSLSPKIISISY